MNNELLQGGKATVHHESSLRNMLNDVLSDECAGSIACGQILSQWLKSGKI